MSGLLAFAASAVLLVPMGGAVSAPPFEACDSSVSMVFRRYVPEWCGTRDPKGYEQFRSAFDEYQALMAEADEAFTDSISTFNGTTMCGRSAEAARRPMYFVAKQNLDDADKQVGVMLGVLKAALKDHPREAQIAAVVTQLRPNVNKYQESRMRIESIADQFEAAPDPTVDAEPCEAAATALADESVKYVEAGQTKNRLVGQISRALALSELCEAVEVTGPIPDKKVKKAGAPKTEKSGGAAITFPKSLDVGKKPRRLPVDVQSPASGYGTVTVTKGSKGIVATGGQVTQGSFGLFMTIPAKTKTGTVTLTFALAGGPTVKGVIRLT